MMNEREKMIDGQLYNPADEELYTLRTRAHRLCQDFNLLHDTDEAGRCAILRELLPEFDEDEHYFQGPIFFDYGMNIHIGRNFYANFNCTILDICPVRIGDNVMIGTGVSLLTATHPLSWRERNAKPQPDGSLVQLEAGKPITIGSNCWLGSNVTVIGGVTIGEGSVIGAGSVVTMDIPANSFAAGNPCRVIKAIDNSDPNAGDGEGVTYWLYSPGNNACMWEEFCSRGIMGIGWGEIGELKAYPDREAIRLALCEAYGEDSYMNNSLALWQFEHDMKPGDVVFAKNGRSEIVGRGIVEGDCEFDDKAQSQYDSYTRKVRWTHRGNWPVSQSMPIKTLTDITPYADNVNEISALFDD